MLSKVVHINVAIFPYLLAECCPLLSLAWKCNAANKTPHAPPYARPYSLALVFQGAALLSIPFRAEPVSSVVRQCQCREKNPTDRQVTGLACQKIMAKKKKSDI